MVTNVTSLLKTVKAVEDEHTRGTRALESTIEAIAQEIRGFDGPEAPRGNAGPEDLMRATRPITIATSKAVAAGKSCKQDDVIVAANMGRKAISDMLNTCKVSSKDAFELDTGDYNIIFLVCGILCRDGRSAAAVTSGRSRRWCPISGASSACDAYSQQADHRGQEQFA